MTSIFDRDEFNRSLFYPRGDVTPPPAGAVDVFVDVDGARLHVRQHPIGAARCVLLLFHGNGEVVADYDDAAARFASLGAALAVADYRGYGHSEGTPTLRLAIADARPIAHAVGARQDLPLVVMGRSLGGAAAHELYARPVERMVAVVLESTFFALGPLIRRRGLTPPTELPREDATVFGPAGKLHAGRLPLLVLHGEDDDLIAAGEARAAHAVAGSADKQLVLVPGHGHNDISHADAYWIALGGFLARVVP